VQQSDNRQSTVHGAVVNAVTHEPIGRALIYSSDNRFATLTDGEGHFEFTLPKATTDSGTDGAIGFISEGQPRQMWPTGSASGPSWLMARKPGFLDDPNERSQVEASPGSELTISLMPEALIKGRVLLPAADAATGVSVQILSRQVQEGILRWTPGASVRANSNGEFRFAELPPGAYKLVTHEWTDNDPVTAVPGGQIYGFPPVYYPNVTDFAAAATIQLTAGETFQADFSLLRQPYYPVRIPVTNADADGNARANITVSVQGHSGPGYSLGYNADKQRIEGQLPNGHYLVEAATFGPNSTTGTVNLAVAGAPVEGPSVVLTRNSSLTVNVKEEFTSTNWSASGTITNGGRTFAMPKLRLDLNLSVEAADDFAQQRGGSLRPPAGPNDDSMVLEDLPPGRYWLRPQAARGYIASATMGSLDLLHQPIVVGTGSTMPIEITMRDDNAEIEGTVASVTATATANESTAYAGSSTPSAYIYCIPLPDSPGQFLQLSTSSDGKFDYQMVAPGSYRLLAFKSRQPNLPYRDAEAMRAYEAKGQIVRLSSGQKANVQLQIISISE
jgi:hypothetical protein